MSPEKTLPTPNNLPPWNPLFFGRTDLLAALHEAVEPGTRLALTGIAGAGKSQIALRFAHEYADLYPTHPVFWMNGASATTLAKSYHEIAELLQLPVANQSDPVEIRHSVDGWLDDSRNGRWLIVLDAADDWAAIVDLMPSGSLGTVLIVSTDATIARFVNTALTVAPPDNDEGAALLANYIEGKEFALADADIEALHTITEELGGLPLALEQAASYMLATQTVPTRYLEILQRGADSFPIEETVVSTINLSLNRLKADAPASADLLSACAFLAPHDIPDALFQFAADVWTAALKEACADDLEWLSTVGATLRYSLLRREHPDSLSTHRVVQQAVRAKMADNEEREWAIRVVEAVNLAVPESDFANWSQYGRLLPHLEVCAYHIARLAVQTEAAARVLNQTGFYLSEQGKYTEALPLFERALRIGEAQTGEKSPDLFVSLNNLAGLYRALGRYSEAESLYRRALAIPIAQSDTTNRAASLNNLGLLYLRTGDYENAERYLKESLELYMAMDTEPSAQIATNLDNLAAVYEMQRRFSDAKQYYERALRIRRDVLGDEHPEVAESLNDMALLFDQMGEKSSALRYYQWALSVYKISLGDDHLQTAICRNNLGTIFALRGDMATARDCMETALPILERDLGEHPRTAVLLANLAQVYCALGRAAYAVPLSDRAEAILVHKLGETHPQTQEMHRVAEIVRELAQETGDTDSESSY